MPGTVHGPGHKKMNSSLCSAFFIFWVTSQGLVDDKTVINVMLQACIQYYRGAEKSEMCFQGIGDI